MNVAWSIKSAGLAFWEWVLFFAVNSLWDGWVAEPPLALAFPSVKWRVEDFKYNFSHQQAMTLAA